jgi:hypothetical protein
MRPITERTMIRRVAARWREQYPLGCDEEKELIFGKLSATDAETTTADEIAGIIGNKSWTERRCDECGATNVDVVRLGHGERPVDVCRDCLRDAINLID